MRGVFMALVFLNCAFFGWARWIDEPAPPAVARTADATLPALQLVRGDAGAADTGVATAGAADAAGVATPDVATAPVAPVAPEPVRESR